MPDLTYTENPNGAPLGVPGKTGGKDFFMQKK